MKQATKVWLIVATALLLSGAILFGGIMATLHWDFTKLTSDKHETTVHKTEANFSHIEILSDTADIILLPTDEEPIYIGV